MVLLENIIKTSKQMDDLNGVMVNVGIGTEQYHFILEKWSGLRKILIEQINEYRKQIN